MEALPPTAPESVRMADGKCRREGCGNQPRPSGFCAAHVP
jgi:hypothetical protein